MYESFYKFKEKPFTILPDPTFLFLSQKHRMALSMLEYGLANQAGFTVITGEIGSGKTTLVRKLLQQLDTDFTVGLVSNTQSDSFEELLRWILFAFELEYQGSERVELYHVLTDFLIKEYAEERRVVLIIDEAQNLGPNALEQLRMLSNVNVDNYQILQLILIGQPNLRELLRCRELEQFAQRISVDYHLQLLDAEETEQYISHRINIAGGDPRIFDEGTSRIIWRYTRGVPRLINIMCDTVLVYGFAEQKKTIDAELIHDVVRDKEMGLSPLNRASDEQQEELKAIQEKFNTVRKNIEASFQGRNLSSQEKSIEYRQDKKDYEQDENLRTEDKLTTIERLYSKLNSQ